MRYVDRSMRVFLAIVLATSLCPPIVSAFADDEIAFEASEESIELPLSIGDALDATPAEDDDTAIGVAIDASSGQAIVSPVALDPGFVNAEEAEASVSLEPDDDAAPVEALAADGLVDGHEYIIYPAIAPNLLLDVQSGSKEPGANVRTWYENRSSAQRWRVSHDGSGALVLVSVLSGQALSVAPGKTTRGANVEQQPYEGDAGQQWQARKNVDGSYTLVAGVGKDLALDISGGKKDPGSNVQLWTINGKTPQNFIFFDMTDMYARLDALASKNKDTLQAGEYVIASALRYNAMLDLKSAGQENGVNVRLWDGNMAKAQKWIISYDAVGYATITSSASGKVLDVAGGSPISGANVRQWSANGARAQKWIPVPHGDGTFSFMSAVRYGLMLDVAGGDSAAGTNVATWYDNDDVPQRWNLVSTTVPDVPASAELDTERWFKLAVSGEGVATAGGTAPGSPLSMGDDVNGIDQFFRFEKEGDYYRIVGAHADLVLAVRGANIVPRTPIVLQKRSSARSQLFSAIPSGSGFALVNVGTGLSLALAGNELATDIWHSGASAQAFSLMAVERLVNPGYYLISPSRSGSVSLGAQGQMREEGTAITLSSAERLPGQKWRIEEAGESNVFALLNVGSGLALTSDAAGKLTLQQSDGSDFQLWSASIVGGSYMFANLATGRVIDLPSGKTAEGTRVHTYSYLGGPAQRFNLEECAILESGFYRLASAADSGLMLDVSGGKAANGANVQLWKNNGATPQLWFFSYDTETGAYSVFSMLSRKMLDVAGSNKKPGGNVITWESLGGAAQRWVIEMGDGGALRLASALGGNLVLSAADAKAGGNVRTALRAEGDLLQQWEAVAASFDSGDTLHGVDISHWNPGFSIAATDEDFVIIKATEGTTYTDPTFSSQARAAAASGKMYGFYHFARRGDARAQADYFVDTVGSYVGKAALFLDWENRNDENVIGQGPLWAKQWLDRVYERTGVRPLIYMSLSVAQNYDWTPVANSYELWLARYSSVYQNAEKGTPHQSNPPLGTAYFGAWSLPTIYQYTSNGTVDGYGGRVDLNIMYGPAAKWRQLVTGS